MRPTSHMVRFQRLPEHGSVASGLELARDANDLGSFMEADIMGT